MLRELREELELVQGASHPFDHAAYLAGKQTPVFFGSAVNNFGVQLLLDFFVHHAPPPKSHATTTREVNATEERFTGFVFQDPGEHGPQPPRPRRLPARVFRALRAEHEIPARAPGQGGQAQQCADLHGPPTVEIAAEGLSRRRDLACTTTARSRSATPSPTASARLHRPPELRAGTVPPRAPARSAEDEAAAKGLAQLSEEGATQFFRPLMSNDLILGAVGVLQFEVVAYRLKDEYSVDCAFENVTVITARWVHCTDDKKLAEFRDKNAMNLAVDAAGELVYLAPHA
jgi:peptide chain release factor 3